MEICYNTSKRTFKVLFILSLCLVLNNTKINAQEHSHHAAAHEEENGIHRITLSLGHAHVHEGIEGEQKKWLVMGAWALNYDYLFNSKWALGWHNDLILEDFSVENHLNGEENTVLERERPWATKLVGSFKPGNHLSFMLGAGEEIAKSENYFLSTIGLDYGWHLPGRWELGAELTYDIKWHAYDTWIFGVGISKMIGGRQQHHKHKG